MKTIKELEKEIEGYNKKYPIEVNEEGSVIIHPEDVRARAKLQTLKDVLELIDEVVDDLHKNENKDELQHIAYTEMVLMNDFKNKIMGVNHDLNEKEKGK